MAGGWNFVSKGDKEFVFVNTDEDKLKEDSKARFPVHLVRLRAVDSSTKTVSFDWWARNHKVDLTGGFDLTKDGHMYMECFSGNKKDDTPWTELNWPASLILPVPVELKKLQKKRLWVSKESMHALKAHCEAFGPDRKQMAKGKKRKRPCRED